jgi:hypothetical protein
MFSVAAVGGPLSGMLCLSLVQNFLGASQSQEKITFVAISFGYVAAAATKAITLLMRVAGIREQANADRA